MPIRLSCNLLMTLIGEVGSPTLIPSRVIKVCSVGADSTTEEQTGETNESNSTTWRRHFGGARNPRCAGGAKADPASQDICACRRTVKEDPSGPGSSSRLRHSSPSGWRPPGRVRANEEVEIVSEISGKISDIHFKEGSAVWLPASCF